MNSLSPVRWFALAITLCGFCVTMRAADAVKPVLLYTRYYTAVGDTRYEPTGAFSEVLKRLGEDFTVRVHGEPLTTATLKDVKVILVANPNDVAVGTNPPPPHVSAADIKVLTEFVQQGGGFITLGNQENHNLEVTDMNKLLANFGIQATNVYTDAKKLTLPKDAPIIGGLRWAYYTGNSLVLDAKHPAKPIAVVPNDLAQKPEKGPRDAVGVLLAASQPGKGHVVVVTEAGWVANWAFAEEGVGGVAIKGQDNWEIFRRLSRWSAGLEPVAK